MEEGSSCDGGQVRWGQGEGMGKRVLKVGCCERTSLQMWGKPGFGAGSDWNWPEGWSLGSSAEMLCPARCPSAMEWPGPRERAIQSPSSCSCRPAAAGCGPAALSPHHPAAAPTTGQPHPVQNHGTAAPCCLQDPWVGGGSRLAQPSLPAWAAPAYFPSSRRVLSGHPVPGCGARL